MRKGELAIWAVITVALAWGLFAFAIPIFNRTKISGSGPAFGLLLLPFFVQILWFAAGAIYSSRSKRREPILGILLGFGLEFLTLAALIIFSASAHY